MNHQVRTYALEYSNDIGSFAISINMIVISNFLTNKLLYKQV